MAPLRIICYSTLYLTFVLCLWAQYVIARDFLVLFSAAAVYAHFHSCEEKKTTFCNQSRNGMMRVLVSTNYATTYGSVVVLINKVTHIPNTCMFFLSGILEVCCIKLTTVH